MIAADNITDEQIRELRRTQSPVTGNCAWLCTIALGEDDESTAPERVDARARCAEILNTRTGAGRLHCQTCGASAGRVTAAELGGQSWCHICGAEIVPTRAAP